MEEKAMLDFIPVDSVLIAFIKDRILSLTIIYLVFRSMFPESKFLRAIGEIYSNLIGSKITNVAKQLREKRNKIAS